ncbi:bifunctional 4-hydroxy-2-oxoglutarate aldolase/2-dehydro-3-deoxy-phosphogluconate aldolase [Puia dinghuensis]|uniref:Bifunctional 4-hydroxy-2-oxoglutarate aldolase/2-dehydro-3-deoxy-phosphogluconate aldolase n=1 Tax=Puia dinghuensis TaxID=1792502 RepID=A0A8J2UI47_9BACT|nr:bifunctional 4-hydroxy-2-oxoglutarate aldolase/2-dehydro-3-deoxy-phosphogluconate aldolase [Puia dinghuensis]GGB21321.1 bifunctional 4-hydroxy-2-oxoglutarate aldolase/2-dehydro-3-deoxy-phosphogluconate aldolase [Puia dinghuensis]
MSDKKVILQSILAQGILPLFYWESPSVCLKVIQTLYRAGVRAVEYTNRGTAALDNFTMLKKTLAIEAPDLYLGIGTVKSKAEAEAFVKAGADFIVAPIINPEVADVAAKAGLLWIPGCMTPTEIYLAQQHRAEVIKIFPANILGPEFVSSIRELFQGQRFIPTGGVEIEETNIRAWIKAGVCAVGLGSKLISKDILINENYDLLYQQTIKALTIARTVINDTK